MLFYKALLAILASTAVVWALPVLGDSNGLLNGLTGKLNGALGNTTLGNLNIAELIDLDKLLGQILGQLENVKETASGAASNVVDTASGAIPGPVSGAIEAAQNAASGVVDTASKMIPTGIVNEALNTASDPVNTIVDAASDATSD